MATIRGVVRSLLFNLVVAIDAERIAMTEIHVVEIQSNEINVLRIIFNLELLETISIAITQEKRTTLR